MLNHNRNRIFIFLAGMLIVFAFASRIYQLGIPENYYFDEVYHAMTAKLISRNDPRGFEWTHGDSIEKGTYVDWLHPPNAKYMQAAGMLLFGENAWGWRMSSAIMGTLVVAITGFLAHRLFRSKVITLLALGLTSVEGLLLVQSRIAMNDIHVVFFIMLTVVAYSLYRNKPTFTRLLMVGGSAGLAVGTKWSGVYILGWVLLLEFFDFVRLYSGSTPKKQISERPPLLLGLLTRVAALVILPAFLYLGSYWLMFSHGKTLQYFVELHNQILGYQLHLVATHSYQSRPWQWFLDLRPVWYHVMYNSDGTRADIYALGNPIIFWGGAIAVVFTSMWLLYRIFASRKSVVHPTPISRGLLTTPINSFSSQFSLFLLITAYWIVWLPWTASPRIMFFYHYAPAVPLMIIITSYWLAIFWHKGNNRAASSSTRRIYRSIPILFTTLAVGVAVWLGPQWLAISIPDWWKQTVFFFGLWQ